MEPMEVPAALADRLGVDASAGLVRFVGAIEERAVNVATERAADRFERRLVTEAAALRAEMVEMKASLRQDVAELTSDLRQEMASRHFALLKWSFLFWIGQAVTVAALLGVAGR